MIMAMATLERVCARPGCGQAFDVRSAAIPKRYCSLRCAYAVRIRHQRPRTTTCARSGCGKPVTDKGGKTAPRYCSRECYWASLHNDPQQAGRFFTCRCCQKQFERDRAKVADPSNAYCSRACFAEARRRRVLCVCERPGCGKAFEVHPARLRGGSVRFCSRECSRAAAAADAASHERAIPCPSCGTVRTYKGYEVRHRSFKGYCSRDCARKAQRSERVERPCAREGCTNVVEAKAAVVARGHGRYCSRTCTRLARRRQSRFRCVNARCRRHFSDAPSQKNPDRCFCSRKCYLEATSARQQRCKAPGCVQTFNAYRSQHRLYCSLACANRGRDRKPHPEDAERNARILGLHAEGKKPRQIHAVLTTERPEWWVSPAALRQILARAKKARRTR